MNRRHRRVLPATLVALVLLAAMVLITVSTVQLLFGQAPLLPLAALGATGGSVSWNAVPVFIAAGVLIVLGLILLACAWLPGKPTVLALSGREDRMSAGVTRASLRRDLTGAAGSVDGIFHAATTLTPARVRATVHTGLSDTSGLSEQVRSALGERLAAVAPARSPRIVVKVKKSRSV